MENLADLLKSKKDLFKTVSNDTSLWNGPEMMGFEGWTFAEVNTPFRLQLLTDGKSCAFTGGFRGLFLLYVCGLEYDIIRRKFAIGGMSPEELFKFVELCIKTVPKVEEQWKKDGMEEEAKNNPEIDY